MFGRTTHRAFDETSIPAACTGAFERVRSDVGDLWLLASDTVMLPYLRTAGTWEPTEGALLRTFLRPGGRFLDVGANVGYFSALAASVSPTISVDAVEPVPSLVALLRLNLFNLAPAARIWPVALAAERSLVAMASPASNPGDSRADARANVANLLVPAVPGDEVFEGQTFDVIKVDVQGFELDVVSGLRETIRRSRRVTMVVEFWPEAIRTRGMEPRSVLAAYRALGLSIRADLGGKVVRLADEEVLRICASGGAQGFVNLVLDR